MTRITHIATLQVDKSRTLLREKEEKFLKCVLTSDSFSVALKSGFIIHVFLDRKRGRERVCEKD
jgi:hypothetical protein